MNPNIPRRALALIREANLGLHVATQAGPCICSQCEWRRKAAQLLRDAGPRPLFLTAEIRRRGRIKAFWLLIAFLSIVFGCLKFGYLPTSWPF